MLWRDRVVKPAPETSLIVSASPRSQARPAGRPAPRGKRSTLGYIAIIVFVFLAGLGAIGAITVVAAYNALANDPTLPDPTSLTTYQVPEETIVYDRTGEVELARFGDFKREVVTFEEIPPVLLDATTAIEDKTFWENAGFDPVGIIAAGLDSLRGSSRGASTITQQLVRARLLPEELVQDPSRTAERKLKEIIQSIRVTQAFQGVEGKQEIITAYLNQNYYGNQTYGVKAAVRGYFGKELADITPAEAAIIAALPQSPSNYDLVRNAVELCSEDPRGRPGVPGRQEHARRRRRRQDHRAAQRGAGPARRRGPHADVQRHLQRRGLPQREVGTGRADAAGHPALESPPLRVGRPRRAHDQAVRGRGHDLRPSRAGRSARDVHAGRRPAGDRREVGQARDADPAPVRQGRRSGGMPARRGEGTRLRFVPGLGTQPRRQGSQQRRPGRARLPDR